MPLFCWTYIAKHLFSIYCAPLKLLISTLTPFLIQKHFYFYFLTVCLTTVYYCILINLPPNKIVLQLCTVLYNHQFLRNTVTCICFLMQKAKPNSLHAPCCLNFISIRLKLIQCSVAGLPSLTKIHYTLYVCIVLKRIKQVKIVFSLFKKNFILLS